MWDKGLFSSGKIQEDNNDPFVWVYDCGTVSTQRLIDNAIANMNYDYQLEKIDLLVISHFDKDHISGLSKLLSIYKVKHILLPYYSKNIRLALLLQKCITDPELILYYLDPVNAFLQDYGDYIHHETKIYLVPESKEPNIYYFDKEQNEIQDEFLPELDEISDELSRFKNNVKLLKYNTWFKFNEIEFIPYNQPLGLAGLPNINWQLFEQDIIASLNKLNNNVNNIKNVYIKYFGGSSYNKNAISLNLFIGNVNNLDYRMNRFLCYKHYYFKLIKLGLFENISILYTGDAFLDKKYKYNDLKNYMKGKLKNLMCLQVAHHGSEYNWYKGLAKDFSPGFSIFSSDPTRKKPHPDAVVVRDFLPYTPIQVDKNNALVIRFHY